MGHVVRVLTDENPMATVLSIDGTGAYDHVHRSAMLKKVHSVPGLRGMLHFVRETYAEPTTYMWRDQAGMPHRIVQAEGSEQGDPLMPLLFGLAIHDSLQEVKSLMDPRDALLAFLDDVYVISQDPNRVRQAYDLLGDRLATQAGIRLHIGNTRVWNRASVCPPPRMAELGPEVWNPTGIKVLGTPVGSAAFVQEVVNKRLRLEAQLWNAIPSVPDLQAAWQILLQCAGPRCHHILRTLPPSQSEEYARSHDDGMERVMRSLVGISGEQRFSAHAYGWVGVEKSHPNGTSSLLASWADALQMVDQRLPEVANRVVNRLADEESAGSLGELRGAASQLDRHGFVGRPDWHALRSGARPEPGEWLHGWQYCASSSSEHHYRRNMVLDQSCAAGKAHLRSHSGPGASDVLCGCPSKPEFRIEGGLFRTLILERLRLPLQVAEAVCECGADLDREGRHRAVCTRSGRLKTGALAPKRTLARVCREAGATERFNAKLRDMNLLSLAADDERAIEVLASGLPLFFGAQLAVDVTLRCALTPDGRPQPGAAAVDGAVCSRAREDKERKYPELLRDDRCRLVVLALETGGRWSEEAVQFVESLAVSRAREALAWRRRWTRMLSVSCARSFACSLVVPPKVLHALAGADGPPPDLADLFEAYHLRGNDYSFDALQTNCFGINIKL